jgi:hypothetical protein
MIFQYNILMFKLLNIICCGHVCCVSYLKAHAPKFALGSGMYAAGWFYLMVGGSK